MRRVTPVALIALTLNGCTPSKPLVSPFFLPPPPKPPAATNPDPCLPTPLAKRADGALDKGQVEEAIRAGDADLARCRADRDRWREAWLVS